MSTDSERYTLNRVVTYIQSFSLKRRKLNALHRKYLGSCTGRTHFKQKQFILAKRYNTLIIVRRIDVNTFTYHYNSYITL